MTPMEEGKTLKSGDLLSLFKKMIEERTVEQIMEAENETFNRLELLWKK